MICQMKELSTASYCEALRQEIYFNGVKVKVESDLYMAMFHEYPDSTITVKSLNIRRTNPTTWMFLVSACRCLCTIYWSQVLSGELRCSWSSADRRCSNCIWVISNWIAYYNSSYIRGMTVHYLGNGLVPLGDDLWWPRTMPPYGVTRKQLS